MNLICPEMSVAVPFPSKMQYQYGTLKYNLSQTKDINWDLPQVPPQKYILTKVASTPAGAQWLSSFFTLCENCTVDFIAAHFYGPSSALQDYLTALHSNYSSLPIWLTEFGFPQQSTNQVLSSLNDTITFCDRTSWIQRYAYFGDFRQGEGNEYIGQNGAVWDGNGDLTEIGKVWLGMDSTPRVQGSDSGAVRQESHVYLVFWISTLSIALLLI
jgi:hypothetical protein